jgi:hypothetical protein
MGAAAPASENTFERSFLTGVGKSDQAADEVPLL